MTAARRHLHVADLTCLHCAEKDAEIERLREINRAQAVENSRLVQDQSAAIARDRVLGTKIDDLTRELANQKAYAKSLETKAGNKVVTDEKIERVIDHWCEHRPRTRRAESFPEGGKRRKLIHAALKLMADAEPGDVEAVCEAIDGLHIAPWEAYGRRYRHQDGRRERTLRNQLEDVLRDETKIEACRRIVRWARVHEARAFDEWRAACETERTLLEVWREEHDKRLRAGDETETEEGFIVDGLVVRP